jgi:hypothetical protein
MAQLYQPNHCVLFGSVDSQTTTCCPHEDVNYSDPEPVKEEVAEPIERCYPIRHEDEILRIIMRQEVWKPPKQNDKSRVMNTLGFFSV